MSEPGRTSTPGLRLDDTQRRDWLRLIRSESVGPRTFRTLVNLYGGAGPALAALPDLARSRGRGKLRIPSIAEAEREIELAQRMGVRFVATGEADYPRLLAAIDSAPPLIAVRGQSAILSRPAIAIVGSRNASASGMQMAQRLARDLADAGFAIVSGLARGIDASAHRASIEQGTIAVLAGGHDRIYPAEHEPLLGPIAETGAVLAEMPMGWEPRGRDFPRRNRIVSGLAYGVVLIEAARRSGSLITSRFALEQGREVFAVPGSPLDPRCEGTNGLIRQGATLVTGAEDVLEVLQPLIGASPPSGHGAMSEGRERDEGRDSLEGVGSHDEPLWDELDLFADAPPARTTGLFEPDADGPGEPAAAPDGTPTERIAGLLGPAPVSVDELVRASALGVRSVHLALLDLEQQGRLERHGAALVSLRLPDA